MKTNYPLSYFLTRSLFLGVIYSLMIFYAKQDSIICCIFGTIIGNIFIIIMHKLNILKSNKSLSFLLSIIFIFFGLIILETFVSSFLLTSTPKLFIIMPTIILCTYASFKKIETINRSSLIVFIISLLFFILIILSLGNYVNYKNVLPFFISTKLNFIKSTLIFAILSSIPNILVYETIPLKKHLLIYTSTSIINTIICFITISSLTPSVATIYSFPEYMVLKRITILEFIENIENIAATIWYFDLFYFITLNIKNTYTILNKKIPFYLTIISITLITTYYIAKDYHIILYIYHYAIVLIFIIFILMVLKKVFISILKHK